MTQSPPCLVAAMVVACLGPLACAGGERGPADAGQAVPRLVAQLRSPATPARRIPELVGQLAALGPEGLTAIESHVDREVGRLAATADARPQTRQLDEEIEAHRDTLRRLRQAPDLSKERLLAEGLPALESLTAAWGRRESALAAWRRKQDLARGRAETLEAVIAAWQEAAGADGVGDRPTRLGQVAARLGPDDAEAARVAAENAVLAKGRPEESVPGMTAVNAIRITCGLRPLTFDPKLCEAAAMHSRDMEKVGFFAHESPLPGKTTPWDRARLSGTTASGENIYMGSTVGADAIKAWFLSPGHHKNMFGEGHVRQGLGRSGRHWTQLFGG